RERVRGDRRSPPVVSGHGGRRDLLEGDLCARGEPLVRRYRLAGDRQVQRTGGDGAVRGLGGVVDGEDDVCQQRVGGVDAGQVLLQAERAVGGGVAGDLAREHEGVDL